jgi:hypothetical protein
MQAKKSTNVRSQTWPARLLGALAAVAPGVAARVAARWFLRRPPRRPFIAAEHEVLAAAERRDLEVEGERIATFAWGAGPTVLLAHGWGGSAGQMHRLVEPLVTAGWRVVALRAAAGCRCRATPPPWPAW